MDKYKAMVETPGKFEGCRPWVPFFWGAIMDGITEETVSANGRVVDVFRIGPEDVAKFKELADVYAVALWEDEQGFVYGETLTEEVYNDL